MKERLENGDVARFVWLDTDDMIADILTKDSKENLDIVDITRDNKFRLSKSEDNLVSFSGGEITITNRKEKTKTKKMALVKRKDQDKEEGSG